jgi:hypothetical protein
MTARELKNKLDRLSEEDLERICVIKDPYRSNEFFYYDEVNKIKLFNKTVEYFDREGKCMKDKIILISM